MKKISTVIQSKKAKIVLALLFCSFLISFVLYKKMEQSSVIEEIKNITDLLKNNHIQFLFYHFITIASLILSSFTIVGFILFPIVILFEFVCVFYNIIVFTSVFHFPGLIYGIFYVLLTKGVYLFLLYILFKNTFILIKNIKNFYFSKEKLEFKSSIFKYLKKMISIIIFIFLNDILIYFFAHKILLKLCFIII